MKAIFRFGNMDRRMEIEQIDIVGQRLEAVRKAWRNQHCSIVVRRQFGRNLGQKGGRAGSNVGCNVPNRAV